MAGLEVSHLQPTHIAPPVYSEVSHEQGLWYHVHVPALRAGWASQCQCGEHLTEGLSSEPARPTSAPHGCTVSLCDLAEMTR